MGYRIFDFHCDNCGLTEEAFVNNDSKEEPLCPRCKRAKMRRLMPAPMWKWTAGVRGF